MGNPIDPVTGQPIQAPATIQGVGGAQVVSPQAQAQAQAQQVQPQAAQPQQAMQEQVPLPSKFEVQPNDLELIS